MTKPHLILVPGLTCTAALWAPQVAALGKHATISIGDHSSADTMAGIARAILASAKLQLQAKSTLMKLASSGRFNPFLNPSSQKRGVPTGPKSWARWPRCSPLP